LLISIFILKIMTKGESRMKIYYLGSFPPPYGGVTIKNKIIFDNLSKSFEVTKIDLGMVKKFGNREIIKLFLALIDKSSSFVIGSASTSRRLFTQYLYYFNNDALNRSSLIIMGGAWPKTIKNDENFIHWVRKYKKIYVETKGMIVELGKLGIGNVSIFPNCRERPENSLNIKPFKDKIKCVYFSQISKLKGADLVIEAAKLLNIDHNDFVIDFYGKIENRYINEFLSEIKVVDNVNYLGEINPENENIYEKLNQYDVLLFPSKWKFEGIPGILVEAKISALPAIVSNINYNSEIIQDKVSGIVLKENTSSEMKEEISKLSNDISLLNNLKINALNSSEKYLVENNIYKFFDSLNSKNDN